MEIEKLIEQLQKSADFEDYPVVASFAAIIEKKYLREAATALEHLQAENGRLRAELEQAHESLDFARTKDAEIVRLGRELEQVKREFDGICEYIDSEGFLRKQFCENGNLDLEPCICPSPQEHPGYIDSDDCEGCDHFCNSWRGQKED